MFYLNANTLFAGIPATVSFKVKAVIRVVCLVCRIVLERIQVENGDAHDYVQSLDHPYHNHRQFGKSCALIV
jgi:hypothetical protein